MIKIHVLFARFIIMSAAWEILFLYRVVEVQLLANVFLQGVSSLLHCPTIIICLKNFIQVLF